MTTIFATPTTLGGAPLSSSLLGNSNNPHVDQQLDALLGKFKQVTTGLGAGIQQTTTSAIQTIAILYLINRTAAEAPGCAASYARSVSQAKGSIFGAKLFNFALSKVDPEVREVIDGMFGGVKAQMCQALELLIEDFSPTIVPTLDEVETFIRAQGGIQKLGMSYMSKKQAEIRNNREEQRIKDELYKAAQQNDRDQEAQALGYANHAARVMAETQAAEQVRRNALNDAIAARGTPADLTNLQEGQIYLFHNGRLMVVAASDESAIMRCAASVL